MPKYVVFSIPDPAWDGIDYLYALIEDKPNSLKMAVIKAKNADLARKKYFYEYIYPTFLENQYEFIAQRELQQIFESFNQNQMIEYFGKNDGNTIWNMISDDDEVVPAETAIATVKKISDETIRKLIFLSNECSIAVSEIEYEG